MGKPEVQHCKLTVLYDGTRHDVYANGYGGKWTPSVDQPILTVEAFEESNARHTSAVSAILKGVGDLIERKGLVIL